MTPMDYSLPREEQALFMLRRLYEKYGYTRFKMSKFEEYDLYARNKDFLVSEGVITFTDTDGRLMALKPDVTLSIIKNSRDAPGFTRKVYYTENVYRVSGSTHTFKEIMQTGLECIGDVDLYCLREVIALAAESLRIIDADNVLELSHMGVIAALVDELALDEDTRAQVLRCISEKNTDGVRRLCPGKPIDGVLALIAAHGPAEQVIAALRPWCGGSAALDELAAVTEALAQSGCPVQIDFSIVNDMNYYNGITFQGYIRSIPRSVLFGGQYDSLMQRMGRSARAVGFAIYLDLLERLGGDAGPYDVDTVLIYGDGADVSALTRCVNMLTGTGLSVMACRTVPDRLAYRQLLEFRNGALIVPDREVTDDGRHD